STFAIAKSVSGPTALPLKTTVSDSNAVAHVLQTYKGVGQLPHVPMRLSVRRIVDTPISAATSIKSVMKRNAVDQLVEAEALMYDAFNRVSRWDTNDVERLRAEEEMRKAHEIRMSVLPWLSSDQQKALNELDSDEQLGISKGKDGKADFQRGHDEFWSLI